jgi:hypothetical protein
MREIDTALTLNRKAGERRINLLSLREVVHPFHSRGGLEANDSGRSELTMFEAVAMTVSDEMRSLSSGVLQCLPYSRALLDFFEKRGVAAKPLVVRGVVFGQHPTIDWANPDHMKLVSSFFQTATSSPDANDRLQFTLPAPTEVPRRAVTTPTVAGTATSWSSLKTQ